MKLRYVALIFSLIALSSAHAYDHDRNVAGKLTSLKKPQIRVLTADEKEVAAASSVALNLDAGPNEIICRKERVSRTSSSRLRVLRCRTRAEIREQAERELALNGKNADDMKRRMSTARSANQLRDQRNENRHRVRRVN